MRGEIVLLLFLIPLLPRCIHTEDYMYGVDEFLHVNFTRYTCTTLAIAMFQS